MVQGSRWLVQSCQHIIIFFNDSLYLEQLDDPGLNTLSCPQAAGLTLFSGGEAAPGSSTAVATLERKALFIMIDGTKPRQNDH